MSGEGGTSSIRPVEMEAVPAAAEAHPAGTCGTHRLFVRSSMDGSKGEARTAEQAASLFGSSEPERVVTAGGGKRRNCKVISGVR